MKVYCDICERPMEMFGEVGKQVTFTCDCGQVWSIDSTGLNCTILKTLWPSSMKRNSKMYRDEFLPAWLKSKTHIAKMMIAGGFWSEEYGNSLIKECREQYDKYFLDNPEKLSWWKFWRR